MLQPKKIKHRKVHKIKLKTRSTRGTKVIFGAIGLKAMASRWITARQIEAARRTITRKLQRGGKVWIRVFPDTPRTAKSSEVGMGGGSGSLSHFIASVEAGKILFEIGGVDEAMAREALRLASYKLPMKTKIVSR